MNPEFRKLYETDEQVKELVDMSKRLEGLPRHTSMHAAGVVISQKAVDEYVPLVSGHQTAAVTTQFTMTTLEELGLLKMDFLGLRNLTVIRECRADGRRQRYGVKDWIWTRLIMMIRRYWITSEQERQTVCSSWKVRA